MITDILDELGISYRRGGESKDVRGGWVGIVCIWCGRGEYSLGIRGWGCSCWRCGKHPLAKSLAEASGKTEGEVKQMLGGIVPDEPEPERRGQLVMPSGIGRMSITHIRYLEGRGLDSAAVENVWEVQGISIAPRLAWRLWVPIKDREGTTVSWTTRSLLDCKDRRYIGAKPEEEIESPKQLLYGEHLAGHGVVVVEGPTDAWRIGPGTVATMGVDWTDAQRLLIGRHPVRAIAFDMEPFARRRARELYDQLVDLPGQTTLIELESAKDPGAADQAEIDEIRQAFLR